MVRIPAARENNAKTRKTPDNTFRAVCFSGGFSMEFFFPFLNIERIKMTPKTAIRVMQEKN